MFKNIINNITSTITNKVNIIKEENNHYKELLEKTTTFKNLYPIPNLSSEITEHKITTIITDCPDINKEKAELITKLIPINETFLTINYSKEIKTNKEYYLIATNKYFWIITQNAYGALSYSSTSCQIIKNNLLSKTILLNNILLEVNGTDTKINNLINILTNQPYRENIIKEKTNYLCEIIPTYQKINSNYSGISLDNNNTIVFHNKVENYKTNINEIAFCEILLDNNITFSTKNNNQKITTFLNDCYQITVRITLKNNKTITLPILEPNTFNSKYQRTDTIFQTNLKFDKDLIEKINSLIPKY